MGTRAHLLDRLPGFSALLRIAGWQDLRAMNSLPPGIERQRRARRATGRLERAWAARDHRERADPEIRQFAWLLEASMIAPAAYEAGDLDKAARYASDVMQIPTVAQRGGAPSHVDWGRRERYGAHIVLGKVALRKGDVNAAEYHLVEATDASMSSSALFKTSVPDTELAEELLKLGKVDSVVAYLDALRRLWPSQEPRLDEWLSEIRDGRVPDFTGWRFRRT